MWCRVFGARRFETTKVFLRIGHQWHSATIHKNEDLNYTAGTT